MALNVDAIRRQFPLLLREERGRPLVYLDTAATAQKPQAVLHAIRRYYEEDCANPHRGMHVLAERATIAYENARETVRRFLHAARPEEIIFLKNTTEAINLVARSWGTSLRRGDAVILSALEHHANIIPWLQLKEERGIELRWIDCEEDGRLRMEDLHAHLADGNTKLVAVTGQSNVLGVQPPLEEIVTAAHAAGARILIDAAQLVAHRPIDLQALGCDFLVFSGHKLYGPDGIGVLYGKRDLLRAMPPFLGGGMMIETVTRQRFTPADIPGKFEAGTQPVAAAVGLAAAIEWLTQFPWEEIMAHDRLLLDHACAALSQLEGVRLWGPARGPDVAGCIAFTVDGIHPHDLTELLGRRGMCLRAGHHCAQPLHERLGVVATTRMSFGIYSLPREIDAVAGAIPELQRLLR